MKKMNRAELYYWKNQPTMAYFSGWGGIEIKEIDHGIEDYIRGISGAWHGVPKVFRVRVYYETTRPYFVVCGHRIHLDECLRV